ncbi:hypothetical protein N665_2921s0003 [Sinapis alba]|nr:hypothetical protein N665_2921s0003 [Sinapis alba]
MFDGEQRLCCAVMQINLDCNACFVILRSRTCSNEATMWMYFFRGKLERNFFTNFESSIFSPKDADFEEISDNLPTKSSIFSVSFIFKRSNSAFRNAKIIICRQFRPSDITVKLQKKMKRRVEIPEIEDFSGSHGGEEEHYHHEPPYEPQHEYPVQSDNMTTPLLC